MIIKIIYQTLRRLIPTYFMICIVNTVVGETATLLNNYHSREKETNIGSLVADSMIDAVSITLKILLSKNKNKTNEKFNFRIS